MAHESNADIKANSSEYDDTCFWCNGSGKCQGCDGDGEVAGEPCPDCSPDWFGIGAFLSKLVNHRGKCPVCHGK